MEWRSTNPFGRCWQRNLMVIFNCKATWIIKMLVAKSQNIVYKAYAGLASYLFNFLHIYQAC